MKIDLQALIDMPGAGKAREALIAAGEWKPFADDAERIDWLEEIQGKPDGALITGVVIKDARRNGDLRKAIDGQAKKAGMQ